MPSADKLVFVLGFFKMILQQVNTVENWAGQISKLTGLSISTQALQEKLQFRHIKFAEQLLGHILYKQVVDNDLSKHSSKLLEGFNRVFLEDSTCVNLPQGLLDFFPGTVNQKGATSQARIQLRVELKSGEFTHIELQSYRDNDQKFSSHILHNIKPGDLVIRDLGYWALWVFGLIIKQEAFFLSRYFFGTHVYDANTGEQIDLFKKLRSNRLQGNNVLDMEVLLGKKEQLPVRLVAIKAPQHVEQERKRKMRKDKKAKRSKDYWEMLGWTIYVTNVSDQVWKPMQILEVYGYRWRIEIIFKCWKSKFNFAHLFNKKSMSPPRAFITFYLLLVWLTLFFVKWHLFFLYHVYQIKGKILSLFKFADFVKQHFNKLYDWANPLEEIEHLARYCSQTKRKTKSTMELLYMLNFT